jgi:hypothetical protein
MLEFKFNFKKKYISFFVSDIENVPKSLRHAPCRFLQTKFWQHDSKKLLLAFLIFCTVSLVSWSALVDDVLFRESPLLQTVAAEHVTCRRRRQSPI